MVRYQYLTWLPKASPSRCALPASSLRISPEIRPRQLAVQADLTPNGRLRQLQQPQKSSPWFAALQGKYLRRIELYAMLAFRFTVKQVP